MDWKILEHLEWKSLHRVEIYEAAQQIRFSIDGFVLINLVILAFVCAIYSQIVGPKIDQLSRGNRNGDLERQPLNQETASSTGKKLFIAYCHQLWKRIALGVIFIILQTRLLYPLKFSSKFNCYLIDGTTQPKNSSGNAQNSTLHDWHNQRAEKKTWMYAVLSVNGILVAGILFETVYLFSWACIKRSFMQDANFLKNPSKSQPTPRWKELNFSTPRKDTLKNPKKWPMKPTPRLEGRRTNFSRIHRTYKGINYSRDPRTFGTPITFFRWSRRRHTG